MQTIDGRTIHLDLEKMGPNPEKALKQIVWAPAIFYIIFLGVPLIMLASKLDLGSFLPVLYVFCIAAGLGGYAYMRKLIQPLSPLLPHKGAVICIHFRMSVLSAIICFVYAGVSFVVLFGVVAMWLYFEYRHFSTLTRVTDEEIYAAYPVRFSTMENGDLLYDSRAKVEGLIKEPWHYTKAAEAFLIPVGLIIGGFLYVRSFAFRDSFEPRFLIAGCIALFIAIVVRSFITRVVLDIRAVQLKAQGKF